MGENISGREGKGKGEPILSTLTTSRKQKNHKMWGEKGISSLILHVTDGKIRLRGKKGQSQVSYLSDCCSFHFDTSLKAPKPAWGRQHEGIAGAGIPHTAASTWGSKCVCPPRTGDLIPLSLINSPMSPLLLWVEGNFAVRVKGYFKANTQARTSSSSVLPSPLPAQVLRFIH